MAKNVCVVVGVGPGNGAALARRFAAEGFAIALLARGAGYIEELASELGEDARAYTCDVTDGGRIADVMRAINAEMGSPSVLLWNAGSARWGNIDELTPDDFRLGFEVNVIGAAAAVQAVLPGMREAGSGSIVFTGATASLRGKPFTTAFASAKAAQRSLAQSLARQLGPQGIHVSLVIVDGRVITAGPEDTPHLRPHDVAETVWFLTRQPRSAWSFEVDLRPHDESW